MYKAPTEPLTIGGVLDDGLRIYRETFTKVWVFGLIAGVLSLPMTFVANQLDPEAPSLPEIASLLLIVLLMSLVTLILYAMLIARMGSIVRGEGLSFGAAVRLGLRRSPAYIGAALLFGLMIGIAVLVTVLIVAVIAGDDEGTIEQSWRWAPSLIPIVLAYAIAHYFSLLVFEGQAFIALLSDPLGEGWDLFGTADDLIDFTVVSPNTIAYVQVAAIVFGHVCGVIAAHDRAVELYPEKVAVRSQYPMLGVMIAYTVGGLLLLLNA